MDKTAEMMDKTCESPVFQTLINRTRKSHSAYKPVPRRKICVLFPAKVITRKLGNTISAFSRCLAG
jgi:hypothetical protein